MKSATITLEGVDCTPAGTRCTTEAGKPNGGSSVYFDISTNQIGALSASKSEPTVTFTFVDGTTHEVDYKDCQNPGAKTFPASR